MFMLVGCGGSDSKQPQDTNKPTGYVGDGYIQGAYVCHDTNNNMDCLDETYAITDANGAFSLSNYNSSQDLLVQIPVGAVDNGPFSDGSTTPRVFNQPTWYYYPANATSENTSIFISPLSTLVYAQIQNIPGVSIEDATNSIASSLGINSSDLLGNYLESNSLQSNFIHFSGELAGASIANYPASVNSSTYGNYLQNVLANSNNIGNTATTNNPLTYNTTNYSNVSSSPTQGAIALIYTPVNDVCYDLENGVYFAFEDWDSTIGGTPDKEHKTLYIKTNPVTGEKILNLQEQVENGNAWSIHTVHTTTETDYLQKKEGVVINMDHVNDSTVDYTAVMHDIPLPAKNTACNGSNATFSIGAASYKLYVSELDLNGISGSSLPKGPSVAPLIDSVTFGAGDKLYKAMTILQNDVYIVEKGEDVQGNVVVPSPANDYIVYHSSIIPIANSANIYTMAQSLNTTFVVNYKDVNNYEKIQIASVVSSNNNGTVTITKYNAGVAQPSSTMTYELETHNGTTFFVVKNYYDIGVDLFIGKIDAIDANSLVFGSVGRAGKVAYLTEDSFQNGDVMDDIMLNESARNRVIQNYNTSTGLNIPIPALP